MTPKITPERLRKYADMYDNDSAYNLVSITEDIGIKTQIYSRHLYPTSALLGAIADSIDEHYVDKYATLGGRYIELPTTKDGEHIYIGDTVYDKDGTLYYVQGVSGGKRNVFLSKFGEGKDCVKPYCSQDFTKTKPDSWERIIEDAIEHGFSDRSECSEPTDETAAQLIDRCLKLAGETGE